MDEIDRSVIKLNIFKYSYVFHCKKNTFKLLVSARNEFLQERKKKLYKAETTKKKLYIFFKNLKKILIRNNQILNYKNKVKNKTYIIVLECALHFLH